MINLNSTATREAAPLYWDPIREVWTSTEPRTGIAKVVVRAAYADMENFAEKLRAKMRGLSIWWGYRPNGVIHVSHEGDEFGMALFWNAVGDLQDEIPGTIEKWVWEIDG